MQFRERLEELPVDAYPDGVVPLPGFLNGTAFFSAAAGLVMDTGALELPPFPFDGVMFVGHNLDAADAYEKRWREGRPHGDPASPMRTWLNLYRLLDAAGVAAGDCFFTNAYVGLLAGANPTGDFPGARDARFRDWCRGFLRLQVDTMSPRAIVTLGVPARRFVGELLGLQPWIPLRSPALGVERVDLAAPTKLAALAHPSMYPVSLRGRTYEHHTGLDCEAALLHAAADTR